MIVKLLTECNLEFKRGLHGLVLVNTCQNATLLEITFCGSYLIFVISDCSTPLEIEHGHFTTPTGTLYGALAVYSCDVNYGLVGLEYVPCLPTGLWDTPPLCSQGNEVIYKQNRYANKKWL